MQLKRNLWEKNEHVLNIELMKNLKKIKCISSNYVQLNLTNAQTMHFLKKNVDQFNNVMNTV